MFVISDADALRDKTLDRLEGSPAEKDLTTSLVVIGRLSDVMTDAFGTAGMLHGLLR